ncbi:protein ACTIVITY OF BC1 COMPLEX KINASE 7, chloroplastic-like [Arachis hypogaea]|uniref:protein ACTIVITY OF BC1 COMPLEX KINASE 7, chloroplastic-like n=1 Tax=Arachis hypogaea TaxID=3818 RepID=UPI003B219816
MLAGLESLPEAYQQRIVSMMEQVSWVNSSIRMALHGCYCHHIKLTNHRRTPNSFSFSSSISNPKFPKNKRGQRDSSENDAYPRFLVVMRQTELPASNSKYGTNGKVVRMVPSSEVVKRSTLSYNKVKTVNGAKQNVNGVATIVKRDVNPPLTKAVKSRTSEELPPLEELKVLPSGEGFSWANENYSSWQRSIDVWSFVLSLRIRVLLDNAKWAYIRGFTEDKQKIRRRKTASWLRERVLQLGPTFIKLGQLSSTRSDLFPREFVDELAKLQDKVPAFSPKKAKSFIESELGASISLLFREFEDRPIATASLGQVA